MRRDVKALFWDIGGVILSNGWDEHSRGLAAQRFGLDLAEIDRSHAAPFAEFEIGAITLNQYLDRAVFNQPRTFSREEFRDFMLAQSTEKKDSRAVLDEVTAAGRYLNAALNNEGLELNLYRIREFELTRNFSVFLSSCFLGVRKPDVAIYRRALWITQCAPEQSVFIDDRPGNLVGAREAGMQVILFENPDQLRAALAECGVKAAAA